MRTSFHPRLINPPLSDPGLFISFLFQRRAILFDLGDLHGVSARDLLKVSHVFVSHTHMDHFVGFDALLRLCLGRDKELHVFGPRGFFRNVEGKLAGYTWNLVDDYPYNFRLRATEVEPTALRSRLYQCKEGFRSVSGTEISPFCSTLLEEPQFRIEAVLLDHRIDSLGLSLIENFYVNIDKEGLRRLGLSTGPWLTQFKKALYEERDPDSAFDVAYDEGGMRRRRSFRLGDLAEEVAKVSPGQKICYVTDVVGSSQNRSKIVQFIDGADHLFIEAAFLHCDREMAREKSHLTAREAGDLAREAGVRRFTLFHYSPRYTERQEELEKEALSAFEGK